MRARTWLKDAAGRKRTVECSAATWRVLLRMSERTPGFMHVITHPAPTQKKRCHLRCRRATAHWVFLHRHPSASHPRYPSSPPLPLIFHVPLATATPRCSSSALTRLRCGPRVLLSAESSPNTLFNIDNDSARFTHSAHCRVSTQVCACGGDWGLDSPMRLHLVAHFHSKDVAHFYI